MSTQITTGKVRLSFCHLFTPHAISDDEKEKYSVTLLIPKSDKQTKAKIDAAMAEARQKFIASGKKIADGCKTSLHDGDGVRPTSGEEFGPECKGHWVITVSSLRKPVLVYSDKTPLTAETELYSGCYARAIINFYAYDFRGSKGITAGLNGVMKLEDGEPLCGGVISDSDWDDDDDDDLLG